MRRFSFTGKTSRKPPRLRVMWQLLEEECKSQLNKKARDEIWKACEWYQQEIMLATQNGSPGDVEAWLERVRSAADELTKALETSGDQAKGLLDEWLAHWPALKTDRAKIQGMLFVLASACHHAKASLLHVPMPDRNPRDALLARLGAVYERASGKKPRYSKPKPGSKSKKPDGPFVRFYATIVGRLLPPEVEQSDPAYAVKNWWDKNRPARQASLT